MICKEVNCQTRARYTIHVNEKPEYCRTHKKQNMIEVLNKKCNEKNCLKSRTFGLNINKPTHCSEHKSVLMVNKREICSSIECNISANYGSLNKKNKFCVNHKDVDMKNSQKKCKETACNTTSRYGLPGNIPTHCAKHKSKEMINSQDKRCNFEGCFYRPSYGIENKKIYCSRHKEENMKNLKHKKCENLECSRLKYYGFENKIPIYCRRHKKDGMVDVVHKRCEFENCQIKPSFGLEFRKPIFCVNHKLENMKDVINKKCTSCGLFAVYKKNNFLCHYCQPTPRMNKKETKVKTLLEENNLNFVHNKQFKNDCCLKYRCDFLFDCNTYFVVLECDEDQHSSYDKDCEIIRMNNISTGLGLPTLFIRYNPDLPGFKVKQKHKKLLETLDKYLNMEILEDPTPIYLFYKEKI